MTVLKRILLAGALLLVGAQTASAVPLPQQTGGFGINPARRDVVGVPGLDLTPTNVINRTASNYLVTVFPAILTQSLSGTFEFAETPRNLNASKLVLTAAPGRFVLPAGSTQQVGLRWNLLPIGHKWIVMGVVFQGLAQGQTTPVHVITRLLSVNFLRLPGLTNINGELSAFYGQQFGPRVLRFVSRVKDIGDRFWAPTDGHLTIRDSSGSVAFSAPWSGSVVIPGAQVNFPVDVHQLLPAGQYTATTTMRFGPHRRSDSTAFTLVGPNQLPTPAIAIRQFNATGEIGSPATVTARILSTGTAPANLTLRIFLANAGSVGPGANALASGTVSYVHLAPGRQIDLSRSLGRSLSNGSYRVIATWTDPTGAQHSLEADFTATTARSWVNSVWRFIKDNIVLFIGLLVIALVIAAAWIVRQLRDRQRKTEAELSATRAQLRMARLHGRAGATEERLTARRDPEHRPFGSSERMKPPPLQPEAPAILEPEAEPEPPPPVVVSTGNGDAGEEHPETVIPAPKAPAPPEPATSDPDAEWIPPWER